MRQKAQHHQHNACVQSSNKDYVVPETQLIYFSLDLKACISLITVTLVQIILVKLLCSIASVIHITHYLYSNTHLYGLNKIEFL